MEDSIVYKSVRRANSTILIFSIIGIVIVAGLAALNYRYFYNFFKGPFTTEATKLLDVTDAATLQEYFVTIKGDYLQDTGFQEVQTSQSGKETIQHYYYGLLIGDKWLMVETANESTDLTFTGAIKTLPTKMHDEIILALDKDFPGVKDIFLPVYLDSANFRTDGYIGMGAGGIILILCIFGFITLFLRNQDPKRNPILKSLARFGEIDLVVPRLDNELAVEHEKLGDLHLTSNWVVFARGGSFKAAPYADLLWVYKQVTQHRTNGIPTGKTYSTMFYDKYGSLISVAAKEAQVNEMLDGVIRKAPWVLVGYSDQLFAMFHKDRESMINEVQKRKSTPSSK